MSRLPTHRPATCYSLFGATVPLRASKPAAASVSPIPGMPSSACGSLADAEAGDAFADEPRDPKLRIVPTMQHRVRLGVPEGGKDYAFGDAYPHEANFDLLHGVSFTKGCYVGQEVVARMQNKTDRSQARCENFCSPPADFRHQTCFSAKHRSVELERSTATMLSPCCVWTEPSKRNRKTRNLPRAASS